MVETHSINQICCNHVTCTDRTKCSEGLDAFRFFLETYQVFLRQIKQIKTSQSATEFHVFCEPEHSQKYLTLQIFKEKSECT